MNIKKIPVAHIAEAMHFSDHACVFWFGDTTLDIITNLSFSFSVEKIHFSIDFE